MLKIVDRLILGELWGPFLFGVGLFSVLIISTVVLKEALDFITQYSLPPSVFFSYVGYAMPEFIVLSIPMGTLLGTLLSVGRLNTDNEIIALRACGISIYRVLAPYFVIGVLLSCVTFIGSDIVVPFCKSKVDEMEKAVAEGEYGYGNRQRFHWPFYSPTTKQLQWVLIAGEVKDNTLYDVVLFYFDSKNKYNNFMIESEQAEWSGKSWKFENENLWKLHRSDSGEPEHLNIEMESSNIPDFSIAPDILRRRQKSVEDLSIKQLTQVIRNMIKEGIPRNDQNILSYLTTLYFKWSIPLTPLFFIIVAVPMAIMPQRSSRAMGMGLALITVLIYYSLFVLFQKAGIAGVVPPAFAAWIPNVLLLTVGAVLMRMREQN